ncbi:DUF1281 domain-containing protein [Xenorhabdus budapestensis]|uniref:Uncharacterized protein n=1 Tax=Xenorhabdus budapestensis TaxID=290110 RepID=A0A2D0IM24_XENBU|nr:DUF1281 domain-containing protein [Xenorhabdus budapestensis]PHM22848.1 hypothetical protein Xbud_03717 [Xenorhabdus budapestensis]PHM23147.1 hypothetical protein Xbud_03656 [Xenorhabdus budapestensis]
MAEWITNQLDITGKSVCIDVMQQWVCGEEAPRYRQAVLQSLRLFLAGCAGILKPTKPLTYAPYPALIRGTTAQTAQHLAFEQWLMLLQDNALLTGDTIKRIDHLYRQSGLSLLRWENIPEPAREIIASLLIRQYTDWFGMVSWSDSPDTGACWDRLNVSPTSAQPCDMLMIMPTRLATEINGSSGLLKGIASTVQFYDEHYGLEWPFGHHVRWERRNVSSLTVRFDSPWAPPSAELMGELSAMFDCEIRHWYSEPSGSLKGYDCYDQGEHVDSGNGLPGRENRPALYLVNGEQPEISQALPAIAVGQ